MSSRAAPEQATSALAPEPPLPMASVRRTWAMAFLAILSSALAFALFTDHAWEDFYITYRPSKNLVAGHGLVYQPGQRVHSFTSPANVLVPAALAFATGDRSDALVLWLFRAFTSLVLAAGVATLAAHRGATGLSGRPAALFVLLLCFEAKTIDFAINGQEGGLMVGLLCLWLVALAARRRRWLALGCVLAALQYTRPDAFVYAAILAAGIVAFAPPAFASAGRRRLLRDLAAAAVLALGLYLPWLAWATWFYGSPLPHTIVAKGPLALQRDLVAVVQGLSSLPFLLVVGSTAADDVFLPAYFAHGGWPAATQGVARVLGLLCALYWVVPFASRSARAFSFAFLLDTYYLTRVITPAPWYLPSSTLTAVLALCNVWSDLARLATWVGARGADASAARWLRQVTVGSQLAVGLYFAGLYGCVAYQLRIQQSEIEVGIRTQIGLWLKASAATRTDTVFLEPLGYIGFFSGLKMYDYPGLCSPEVVTARRASRTESWAVLIRRLEPDWLVLRPREEAAVGAAAPQLLKGDYQFVRRFDATSRLAGYGWIPGRSYLEYDQDFRIYRREGLR